MCFTNRSCFSVVSYVCLVLYVECYFSQQQSGTLMDSITLMESRDTEHKFVDDVPEKFICSICTNVLRDPRLTECCGQHFCQGCLLKWLRKHRTKSCLHCRLENFNHILDKSVQREINQLKIRCSLREKGCQWVGELGDLQTHLNSEKGCGYVKVRCPNICAGFLATLNSNYHAVPRKHLLQHLVSECPLRSYKCKHCGLKDTYEFITKRHYVKCPEFPLECPNKCGATGIRRILMATHREQCPLERVPCPFQEAGCEVKLVRRDLEKHVSQETQHHLLLTYQAMCTLKQRCSELERKVR